MAQVIADRRDIDFVLYEQMDTEAIIQNEKYSDLNRKMFDMIISEAPGNDSVNNHGIRHVTIRYVRS